MLKKLYDSAFRRTNGLFDEKVLGQIVNAIPRKDDDIDFNEENLLAYLKGACVRITLKYTTNKKGKQVKVIDYEQSRMTNKKLTANENNEEIEENTKYCPCGYYDDFSRTNAKFCTF